jgi:hypothetical protein
MDVVFDAAAVDGVEDSESDVATGTSIEGIRGATGIDA